MGCNSFGCSILIFMQVFIYIFTRSFSNLCKGANSENFYSENMTHHTIQNSQNKWTKILGLKTNTFELKMIGEKRRDFFYLKILLAPSKLLLPSAKNLSRWTEGGQQKFKIKNYRPLFTIISTSKMLVLRHEILVQLFYQFQVV